MGKKTKVDASMLSSRRLLVALDDACAKLEAVERTKSEAIAIIGMGCRFPGGVTDPESFWQLLKDGVDAIAEVPTNRWDVDAFYDPNPDAIGKIYTRYGGFLTEVDQFDPQFFGISPREAVSLDPQQRLLLEICWEALENAGQVYDKLVGSQTGVFVGVTANDYMHLMTQSNDLSQFDSYFISGNPLNAIAGRLSYTLGLKGPCMAIDTACSSSLVAVHLACQSLRSGESDMTLVGGTNLILSPWPNIAICRARMLAPDGRCKTFDAAADGYVRGEGCGVVVLKRLSDAKADGDNILALIRGSAVNQDGASSGFTVPNGSAQQTVIRRALAQAKIAPAEINYVEAHGTGTSLGDPIEVNAATAVLGEKRLVEQPLIMGTVKTNIGHLEAAAGIAGLMKVVLALQHEKIPQHLHLKQPSPHIPWSEIPVRVPTEQIAWSRSDKKRLAGVSSFGASGTNAHVVVEEAPPPQAKALISNRVVEPQKAERPLHLLTLSAKTETALMQLAGKYAEHVEDSRSASKNRGGLVRDTMPTIGDFCLSANATRTHFSYRLGVVTDSFTTLREQLLTFAKGQTASGVFQGEARHLHVPQIAFLFTGQGSQYLNMGRELYETQATFRKTLDRCNEILRSYLDISILEILYPNERDIQNSQLNETAYTQPALFAFEYALAELWKSWGIKPLVVMGHSVGEYVAACVAGVFSLENGLKLIAERGRLMQELPQNGQMVAVPVNENRAVAIIQSHNDDISIAAINGPDNVVISGSDSAVETVITRLSSEGIRTKKLTVSHAFHSPLMEPMLQEFERVASELSYSSPEIALCSNITGELIKDEIATPQYWVNHVRQPVQFEKSMGTLKERGCGIFLEIGPKSTLLGMGRQCLPDEMGIWLPSLRQKQNDWQQLLHSLAELYIHGIPVDWQNFDRDYPRRRVILPTYPWQHKRYWIKTRAEGQAKTAVSSESKNISILNNLQHGNMQQLVDQLTETGQFSADEQKGLPKFLQVLTHQYQQQIAAASIKNWLYEVEWRTQPRQGLSPDYLLTPTSIHGKLQPYLEELKFREDLVDYRQIFNQLETLSIGYVVNAFHKMGWIFTTGQRFSTDDLTTQLGIVSQHQRLSGRLLEMLAEEGFLRSFGHQWEVIKAVEHENPQTLLQTLKTKYPVVETELTMLARCGEKLAEVLQGDCDPLHELLFPDGDLTTAAKLYQDTLASQVMNTLVQKTVTTALARLPQDRKLRILEIGAGTGGTSAYILPHLPPLQTDYVFTDLSTLFLSKAKEKFRDYSFIQYQLLDIEQAPDAQEFKLHQYDLILIANVLHATKDLRQTVQHVQQLLMPGGVLVLLENTERLRFVDLIFGLTEGWWRFTDSHLRPDHPLISTAQWQTLLEENSFQQTATLSASQEEGGILSKQAVVIAQAVEIQPEQASAHWLIFADGHGIAQQLQTLLQARGDVCTLVFSGKSYKHLTEKTYQLNPNNPGEFQQLLEELSNKTLQGVIPLWSLDAPKANTLTAIDLETTSKKTCGSVLLLIQALLKAEFSKQPQLWLVSQGAVAAKNSQLSGLAQSPLWGMGKVIALEHPEFKTVRVDLDHEAKQEVAAQMLFEEICSHEETQEDQIAFYNKSRHVARLVRHAHTQTNLPVAFRDDATYLITGGLGGLGLLVADWMAKKGAKHLVLVGRSAPNSTAIQKTTALEQAGVQVMVSQADISVAEQAASVLSDIERDMPPLRGIIHAAGVLDDGVLQQQTWARFAKVMAPKVSGAWHLHNLTQRHPLDLFILFSTTVSLLGSAGQANHAAANSFLDMLAYYRRAQGLAGLSINWGPWAEVGAAAERKIDERIKMAGASTIAPLQGLLALEQLLSASSAQVGVIPVEDWSRLTTYTRSSCFFNDLIEPVTLPSSSIVTPLNILQQLKEAQPGVYPELLAVYLKEQVAHSLHLTISQLDVQQPLNTMGVDSLIAVELRNRIRTQLEVDLTIGTFLAGANVSELATQIATQLTEKFSHTSFSQKGGMLHGERQSEHVEQEDYPLSQGQRSLWFLYRIAPENAAYNLVLAGRLRSDLEIPSLKEAFEVLMSRHPMLRTTFTTRDGEPVQQVRQRPKIHFEVKDATHWSQEDLDKWLAEEADRPFDLEQGPLVRLELLDRFSSGAVVGPVLLLTAHHIVLDFWSIELLMKELWELYQMSKSDTQMSLPPLKWHFKDYVRREADMLASPKGKQLRAYWQEQLSGDLPSLNLLTDYPRPAVKTYHGSSCHFELDDKLSLKIRELAKATGSTPYVTMLTAFLVFLRAYTHQEDILIGTPTVGRNHSEFEDIIGYFVNPVVLRADLRGNPTFEELNQKIRDRVLTVLKYQDYPFGLLADQLQLVRDPSRSPLFQVAFVWDKPHLQQQTDTREDIVQEVLLSEQRGAAFDLTLFVFDSAKGFGGYWKYNTDLFKATTMNRMIGYFQTLLTSIVADPKQHIFTLPLLTQTEQRQLLVEWNNTRTKYPRDLTIQQLFEAQVEQTPDAVAVVFSDQQLTYQELNMRANQLAHHLQTLGVGPNVLVGLCVERSLEMIIGVLGILKAGGAYASLDPDYPKETLAFMLNDSQAPVLLTQEKLVSRLPEHSAHVVCLDSFVSDEKLNENTNPVSAATSESLAYVSYTSGSTGRPKGVCIVHQSVVRLVKNTNYVHFSSEQIFLQLAPLPFDASTFEIWGCLLNGAKLVVMPSHAPSLEELGSVIRQHQVTTLWLTAGLFHLMVDDRLEDLKSVRQLLAGGDILSVPHVRKVLRELKDCQLINGYGPTENTTFTCCFPVTENQLGISVPIGCPIANTQVYILDENLRPVPVGVLGELYISGAGLAGGYLNRPELTAEKFIRNPFSVDPNSRLYKTGDLVRYQPDGNIEFLGRLDNQVKIRGFRVEPSEIETLLVQHPEVKETLVIAANDAVGKKRLVAYFVPINSIAEDQLPISELRHFLKEKLPDYMMPSIFIPLRAFPLNSNGKIDQDALPTMEMERDSEMDFVPPRTPTEEILANIWAKVLGLGKVSIHDNFFDLGGDSIISLHIIARANHAGLELRASQIFQYQTVAELASVATASSTLTNQEQGLVVGPVLLTPVQQWFFEQTQPCPQHFNQSVMLEVEPDINSDFLEQVLQYLQVHHDSLRLRWVQSASGWQQVSSGIDNIVSVRVVELLQFPSDEQLNTMETMTKEIQASLNLSVGPSMQVVLFKLGVDKSARLLWVVHHLAVDGVSWRILLEDLQAAYEQLCMKEAISLPRKTTSFREWANRLKAYAQTEELVTELDYWLMPTKPVPLPVDMPWKKSQNRVGFANVISVSLSVEETRALLQEVPQAYNTHINDVLLTALVQSFNRWTGNNSLFLAMEGHGREELFGNIDLSRTVGWFTTVFPVTLELKETDSLGEVLKSIKEQLRLVPKHGIGYGLLKYLCEEEAISLKLHNLPQPMVCFNYLGQFDQSFSQSPVLKLAKESGRGMISPLNIQPYLLEVNGMVLYNRLQMDFTYNEKVHQKTTIDILAKYFIKSLKNLIVHCQSPAAKGYTSSDFPEAELSQVELDDIVDQLN